MTRKKIVQSVLILFSFSSFSNAQNKKLTRDEIIDRYLKKGAWYYPTYSQEWQQKIDEGLKLDSTIAYLWQQKGMAMLKSMKYQEGIKCLDKAVRYDPEEWLEYRAFMNCIYVKDYPAAIRDLEQCKKISPLKFVMDHSYNFYLSLCYLQLNQFKAAEDLLEAETKKDRGPHGEDYTHYLTYFYLAIAKFEQNRPEESILDFDKSLYIYSHFSDAKFYKASALQKLWKLEESKRLFDEAKADFDAGYTINDTNASYERYPYQVNWKIFR
jgi:tetratricopeptide (TPR) repeat protein